MVDPLVLRVCLESYYHCIRFICIVVLFAQKCLDKSNQYKISLPQSTSKYAVFLLYKLDFIYHFIKMNVSINLQSLKIVKYI